MNATALIAIGRQLGFTERITAVQGRVLGAKGVWALHPQHMSLDDPPMIWIRKSQQKIHLVDPRLFGAAALRRLHKAHLIFDLVAPARLWMPSRLSSSTIINLEHNGVPKEIFFVLMEEGLRREVEALTKWEGPGAMRLLWHAVNKTSGVTMQRLQRTATGLQRVLGLTGSRKEDDDSDVEEDEDADKPEALASDELQPDSIATDPAPYSISEGILERLQAGFTPLEDRILYDAVRKLVEETMKRCILEYHIVVPASAEVFIIPGGSGFLFYYCTVTENPDLRPYGAASTRPDTLYLDPVSQGSTRGRRRTYYHRRRPCKSDFIITRTIIDCA
jgi:RNA-dependent RNA polymerase